METEINRQLHYLWDGGRFLILFLILFPFTISKIRIWIQSKRWRGCAEGKVEEVIKRYYRRRKELVGKWYEYPVISYQVGDTTYREEYPHARKELGFYTRHKRLPIRYNEHKPEEFIIQGEYSDYDVIQWLLYFLVMPAFCIAAAGFFAHDMVSLYHSTQTLYDEEIGQDLGDPFSQYKFLPDLFRKFGYIDGLENQVEATVRRFRQKAELLEEMKREGDGRYQEYCIRYERTADRASRQLADIYAASLSLCFPESELEEEKELIWQSVYSDYMRQICPQAAPGEGVYTLKELSSLMEIMSRMVAPYWWRGPEECMGLTLATSYAELHSAVSRLSCNPRIKEKIEEGIPAFVPYFIQQENQELETQRMHHNQDDAYPPIDREAVDSVYSYTVERYLFSGSFQTALWEGAVYAQSQILSRQQADPSLESLARYEEEENPLFDFDPQGDPDAYFHSEIWGAFSDPRTLLREWEMFQSENVWESSGIKEAEVLWRLENLETMKLS